MANGPTLPPQAYTREILTSAFNWLQTQPESVKKLATTPDALVGLFMRAQRYGASSMEVDAPVSSQNFISDLKNLAEGLKQFEKPKTTVFNSGLGSGSNLNVAGGVHAAHTSSPMSTPNSFHQPAPSAINMNRSSAAFAGATASPHPMPSYVAPSATPPSVQSQTQHHSPQSLASQPHPDPSGHNSGQSSAHSSGQSAASAQMGLTYSHTSTTVHASATATQLMLNERSQQMIQEVKTQLNLSSNGETINMLLALGFKQLKGLLAD